MRTTLKHTLAACIALGALMLTGTACTQDDPLGGNNPAGTQLLQLGKVTIAGAETATRSADAATRADIAPDATTGFTGIRKHAFVKDDELVLTLTPPATGGSGTPVKVTAKLSTDGTTWTLPKTYFTAGTTVSATHTPTVPTGTPTGTVAYGDDLVATNQKPQADGTPLALTLTHANAMVEVTPPTGITGYENLTVSATPPAPAGGGAANTEVLATNKEGTSTDLRHRTIAKAGSTLNSVSLTVNTVVYTAPIAPAVVVAANKRYPITLKMSAEEGLTATVAEGTDWGVGGDVNGYPTGLTRYISTPQDLQQLAAEVNGGTLNGADVTVLQTADIDMTGVAWSSIGSETNPFKGSYNGNGYTIDNLTMQFNPMMTTTNAHLGLFGYITGAKITGVHLRDCTVSANRGASVYAGALVGKAEDGCIVTLCSATGSVSVTGVQYAYAGGLVGYIQAATTPNHYTRCTTDVAVTTSASVAGYTGGFTGYTHGGLYAGCIASGKVTMNGAGLCSGFSYTNNVANTYYAIGCIAGGEIETSAASRTAFGVINTYKSCLMTGTTYTHMAVSSNPSSSSTDNVFLSAIGGSSPNATNETAYGVLKGSNILLGDKKIKTLHYSKADGYTTTVVEQFWYPYGTWKDNGAKRPTLDMSYEGNPVLTAGNKVYRVNGYYVTAPGAEDVKYPWNSTLTATTMASDPCGGRAEWLMPTMKDFEAMAGWTGTSNAWNNAVITPAVIDDYINFRMAFPTGYSYWSSTPNTNIGETAKAWCFRTAVNGTSGSYETELKTTSYRIRCVQKQAFPTP